MYQAGSAFLRALADGRAPRAVWSALPGEDWPTRVAEALAATAAAGRGAVAVVPDARDLDRLDAALTAVLGPDGHVALSAALGPAERYRRFLAARRGQVPVVIGTRAAMFAPVDRLGLVVLWDDGDDLHAEPRAPYPHAREVLLTRAQLADAAALVGGYARTAEAQLLVETGWAQEMAPARATVRARAPEVAPTGDDPQLARDPGAATARLPSVAWQAARSALRAGAPVLVQVPRRGYLPSVSCVECHTPARCAHCAGPLELRSRPRRAGAAAGAAGSPPTYACPGCGGRRLRAAVVGARRTAEELGRAFPGVPVRTSGRDEVLDRGAGRARAGGGHAGRRAGRRRRVRRGAAAGHLGAADPGRPAGGGGDAASLAGRGGAGPPGRRRRPGGGGRRRRARRRCRRCCAGIRPGTPPASWPSGASWASRRPPGWPALTGTPGGGRRTARRGATAGRCASCSARSRPTPDTSGCCCGSAGPTAAALAAALHEAVAVRTARKAAEPVRVQVDPAQLI